MNNNTALVLLTALMIIWNVTLWAGFIYVIVTFNASWWLLVLPCFFTVFPGDRK